jgi:hypothetical protein
MGDQVNHLAPVLLQLCETAGRPVRITGITGITDVAQVAWIAGTVAAGRNAVVALQDAVYRKQRRAQQLLTLLLHQRRPDNHIDRARFIFERNEHRAVCRARPLPHGDDAACPRKRAVLTSGQLGRRTETLFFQPRAQ